MQLVTHYWPVGNFEKNKWFLTSSKGLFQQWYFLHPPRLWEVGSQYMRVTTVYESHHKCVCLCQKLCVGFLDIFLCCSVHALRSYVSGCWEVFKPSSDSYCFILIFSFIMNLLAFETNFLTYGLHTLLCKSRNCKPCCVTTKLLIISKYQIMITHL